MKKYSKGFYFFKPHLYRVISMDYNIKYCCLSNQQIICLQISNSLIHFGHSVYRLFLVTFWFFQKACWFVGFIGTTVLGEFRASVVSPNGINARMENILPSQQGWLSAAADDFYYTQQLPSKDISCLAKLSRIISTQSRFHDI